MDNNQYSSKENIAAFSAEFFTASQFEAFDKRYKSSLNGVCGLYDLCVEYGDLITAWEKQYPENCAYEESGVNWLELVETLAGEVQARSLDEHQVVKAAAFNFDEFVSRLDHYA